MRWKFSGTTNWGMRLLAVWLILTGLHPLVQLAFLNLRLLSARLAIAAGVLILLNR